jgi:hypothetical protein
MQYLLIILFAVAFLCVQEFLIILKLTGKFTAGLGFMVLATVTSAWLRRGLPYL